MIVIHFGLQKAGSSSIQRFLKANQAYLRSLGYDYAPLGHQDGRSHLNLTYEVRRLDKFDTKDGGLANIRRYWRLNRGKILIISSEVFEQTAPEGVAMLKNRLSRADDRFLPVMIIRDLGSLVVSNYLQNAKMGIEVDDFDAYVSDFLRRSRADFHQTAKRWADVFGWDRLRVRLLDRDFLLNGDLIDDFIHTAGLEMSAEETADLKRPPQSNVSPGWRVAEALRALYDGRHGLADTHPLLERRRGGRDDARAIRSHAEALGETWGWNSEKGQYLTTRQAQACLEIYQRSIEDLNARLTSKLPLPQTLEARGFAPRAFMPDISLIAANDLRRFYDALGQALASEGRAATRVR
jgi:hypothetical protein